MNLNITEEERKLLLELFQATEKELIAGIDHADARDYKKKLRDQLEVLEKLKTKLQSDQPAA